MKNRTKRIFSLIISFAFMFAMVMANCTRMSHAAVPVYLTISLSSGTVNVGDTVSVTVSASSDEEFACDADLSYDSGLLEFVSSSFGSGTHMSLKGTYDSTTITFRAIAAGEAWVGASGSGYNMNLEVLMLKGQVHQSPSSILQQPPQKQQLKQQLKQQQRRQLRQLQKQQVRQQQKPLQSQTFLITITF